MKTLLLAEPRAKPLRAAAAAVQRARKGKPALTGLQLQASTHMYVHVGSNIYTGGRDREKLPHPTLVGGDPDATCAGTMSIAKRAVCPFPPDNP